MEENRADISKFSDDKSCNHGHEGDEGYDINPPQSPLNESDGLNTPSSTCPDDLENRTDAEPAIIDETNDEPSSPSLSGALTGESPPKEREKEEKHAHSGDSPKPPEESGQDHVPFTPPANISYSSTQMILGIDPSQPVLMPGRPILSPEDEERINKYRKFQKVDGAAYRRVNQFLRKHTYVTAREWAIARLCADFSTRGGAEMTFIGENLPDLVPFMTDTYSPQAVNQARSSFKKKVRKSGATFFYGALCGFFTADELDDILFEASEVARFLLEVEGTSIDIDDEIDIEDRITEVMRGVAEAASRIRNEDPDMANDEPDETEDDDL